MNRKVNIDKLNEHIFEAIEMLKNNSDPKASENEKMDLETAKAISSLAKVAIEGFKVKVLSLQIISKAENVQAVQDNMAEMGVLNNNAIDKR